MSKKPEPGMAFDMQKLNKVFAFLSVLLLITVVWVFLDDYIRPWKGYQIKAMQLKKEKIAQKLQAAEEKIDKKAVALLEADLKKAKEVVRGRRKAVAVVEKEISRVDALIKNETIVNGQLNAKVAAQNFVYEQAVSHHYPFEKQLKKLTELKTAFAVSKDRMKGYTASIKAKKKELAKLKSEVKVIEKKIAKITGKRDLLMLAKSKVDMGPLFALRNAPIIDFLDPTLKIQQIVLENITDDRYFRHVPKVDRCITCHTFISEKGYEDKSIPNPFRTHPNLDLMVGAKSKHPMKSFGCTGCHGGEGHRVNDFNSAAHIPQNEEQKKEWIEKYSWHAPHKIPQEMHKAHQTEASCVKCHQGVEYIPEATVLNEGRKKMEEFGCYACHKIKGWEHKRRPGPALTKIASKVSKEFFKNWVWSPRDFNPHAKMPSFFNQTNNAKPEFVKKNIAEVNAMAEYVWSKSKEYKPFAKYTKGNAEKGEALVKEIGCMGCHGTEADSKGSFKTGAYAGPFLTGTGTKVKDPDWLVSWLLKPNHYQEDTIMPSFRLSRKEANDIATYLLSLKNKDFGELKFEKMDKKIRDDLLVEYFSAFDTQEVAMKKLQNMTDRERTLELGHRSIGKYGCYSCHDMEGFEGRAGIGPELTNVGSKPLTQFGFNLQHDMEHSKSAWIKAHMLNPRRWDKGLNKPFKDILRMPNFYMTESEADAITVALLGQVSDKIPLAGVKRLDSRETVVEEGMKVLNKYNCIGCHQVDGHRGDILALYSDDVNEAPPRLVEEGHRVQGDWLHYFLDNVYPIRPWLKVRMPSFNLSNEERNKIVALFQAKSAQGTFEENHKKVTWLPGEKAAAKKLFKSLDCASCHTKGFNKEEATAPNLHMAKRRLRGSWMKKWLSNPQAIYPETVMPNFWEDGEATDTEIFGGDKEKQINALVKYLQEIGINEIHPDLAKKK